MALKTHSLTNWIITVGTGIITGFDEESAISIEFPNEKWEIVQGGDGNDTTRSYNPNWDMANITITLQDSSLSNGVLNAIAILDNAVLTGTVQFTAKNTLTGQGYTGADAFITKQPDAEIGRNSTTREWNITVPHLIAVESGIA